MARRLLREASRSLPFGATGRLLCSRLPTPSPLAASSASPPSLATQNGSAYLRCDSGFCEASNQERSARSFGSQRTFHASCFPRQSCRGHGPGLTGYSHCFSEQQGKGSCSSRGLFFTLCSQRGCTFTSLYKASSHCSERRSAFRSSYKASSESAHLTSLTKTQRSGCRLSRANCILRRILVRCFMGHGQDSLFQSCRNHIRLSMGCIFGGESCRNCHSISAYRFIPPHMDPDCRLLMEIMFLRDWDTSLEEDLKDSGVILSHERIDQIIACIPSPKLALQFYIWSGEQVGYPPLSSSAAYEITVWYSHKSHCQAFLSILCKVAQPHDRLTPSMVNVLLQGYGWAGMVDRAFNILYKTQGFFNYRSVNCLLHAIIKELRYDLVYKVYMEMKTCGTPLHVSYNDLIYGMSCDGKWQEADDLLQEMVRIGCFPNAATYEMLIESLNTAGQHDRGCKLLRDMIDQNMMPGSKAFNAIIQRLLHSKRRDLALEVSHVMNKCGCTLDSQLYESIFGCSCDVNIQSISLHEHNVDAPPLSRV